MAEHWVSFDCYGTLVDWRTGMEDALRSVLDEELVPGVLARYHELEPALQQTRPLLSYRQVLNTGLGIAAREAGVSLDAEQSGVLSETMPRWPVFPEVPGILAALASDGYRLALLSNVDDDIVERTVPQLVAPFAAVITSQQVGSYKPSDGHFEKLGARVRAGGGRWTHVACSWFHDVQPCLRRDVPAVFINREGEQLDTSAALATFPDLHDLPDILSRDDQAV